jgi:hypothetical protein
MVMSAVTAPDVTWLTVVPDRQRRASLGHPEETVEI